MSNAQPRPRVAFDHAVLDATERLFWGDVWDATPADVAAEHGLESAGFGPILGLRAARLRDGPSR
jgi:hypothetical protein